MNAYSVVGLSFLLSALAILDAQAQEKQSQVVQDVRISNRDACLGEPIQVEVLVQKGAGEVDILINGKPGAVRWLQFGGRPGPRLIHVAAARSKDKAAATQTVKINIRECKDARHVMLRARASPFNEFALDFMAEAMGAKPAAADDQYVWEFGDGRLAYTRGPVATHNYEAATNFLKPHSQWTVAVRRVSDGATGKASIVVPNLYLHRALRGSYTPVVKTDRVLLRRGSTLSGRFRLRNVFAEDIHFERAQIEYQGCTPKSPTRYAQADPARGLRGLLEEVAPLDGRERGSGFAPKTRLPKRSEAVKGAEPATSDVKQLLLRGGHQLSGSFAIEAGAISEDICGVAHHLMGRTAKGGKAYASLYFQIKAFDAGIRRVTDKATLEALEQLAKSEKTDRISEEQLYDLERKGALQRSQRGWEMRK